MEYTYVSSHVGHTYTILFTCIIIPIQEKKAKFPSTGGDFVDESTSKDDMEILFDQLGRLTKVAPVYFVYGNRENKIKFTRNKLNHKKQHYHSK